MYTTAINNLGKVSFHTKYNQDKFCSWYNCTLSSNFPVFPICALHGTNMQGGRSWGVAVGALPERSGSSTKGRIPNIRYFGAKLFSRFTRFLNQSHPAFVELSTRFILLSQTINNFLRQKQCFCCENLRSTKGLRVSVALPESQPTHARLCIIQTYMSAKVKST